MGRFLRQNWIWIVAPVPAVALAVAVLLVTTAGDPADGFVYPQR